MCLPKLTIALFIISCSIAVIACNPDKEGLKFNKANWEAKEDWDYPYRDRMLNDLVKHHKLVGLTYQQLTDSLGAPANIGNDSGTVSYEIITRFESDIDPTSGKNLVLTLSPESVVTSYKISEWKHN